ncbi:MAG: alpha/beta hydrolase [Bdellovibrionota bacterium]
MKKLFYAVVLIFLSIGLVFYFFTLQTFQQIEIARMKWAGVSSIVDTNFHYFEKNNCTDEKNCQCVLLIHGLGDFALTWRNMLSEPKSSFAKNIHFFAPNLPGSLSSPKLKSQDDYNVQNMARLVSEAFIPKCDSWIVVGNSYGGWMAVFMALNLKQIKGLLLLAPAGLKKDYGYLTDYFLNPTVEGARGFYKKLYYNPKDVPDFIFERVVTRLKTQTVIEQLKSITNADYLELHLPRIQIPVSYVWGDADQVIPAEWSESYVRATPNSHYKLLKNCGHVPQKECFSEVLSELNALLLQAVP